MRAGLYPEDFFVAAVESGSVGLLVAAMVGGMLIKGSMAFADLSVFQQRKRTPSDHQRRPLPV